MSKSKKDNLEVVEQKEEQSTFYYFYSQGCGFCKKSEPIVDELNKEGKYPEILKLDLADKDNQGLNKELKEKYKKQCGTPWFINAETGHQVCGYREKDIVEKWLNGEDIPEAPRPKGPMPRPPFMDADKNEVDKWKEDYKKWSDENSHLPGLQTAEQILERPRPKTQPPQPPNPQMTDEQLDEWGKGYEKWAKENSHLPNLQPADVIKDRLKQQRQQMQQAPPPPISPDISNRMDSLEQKLNKLMDHLGVK